MTDRLIAMGFPYDARADAMRRGGAPRDGGSPIGLVAAHLKRYHESHFMVRPKRRERFRPR